MEKSPELQKKYLIRRDDNNLLIGIWNPNGGWVYVVNLEIFHLNSKKTKQAFYILHCYQDRWESLIHLSEMLEKIAIYKNINKDNFTFKPIIELIEKIGYTKLK